MTQHWGKIGRNHLWPLSSDCSYKNVWFLNKLDKKSFSDNFCWKLVVGYGEHMDKKIVLLTDWEVSGGVGWGGKTVYEMLHTLIHCSCNRVIYCYQLSWKCKLATVKSSNFNCSEEGLTLEMSGCKLFSVANFFNSVVNTKLPCYTLPPM